MLISLRGYLRASLGDKLKTLDAILDEVEALSIQTTVNALVLGLGLNGPKLVLIREVVVHNRPLLSDLLPIASSSARGDIGVRSLNV
jgi:hypothetical protein